MNRGTSAVDRALLSSGGVAAVLFCGISTYEMFTRPGFDIERHAISMLSLGDRGWIMASTFVAAGFLALLCAVGIARAFHGRWLPILVAVYGVGLIAAGVFPAPASFGFPPGTPDDQQPVMTTSAIVHSIGFLCAFIALTIACFVGAPRVSAIARSWSRVAGLAMPVLVGLGMADVIPAGIAFYAAALVGWAWLSLMVMKLGEGSSELRQSTTSIA
jgi:hypothetical protein